MIVKLRVKKKGGTDILIIILLRLNVAVKRILKKKFPK